MNVDRMDLGEFFPCLNVRDLERSIEFYERLDFDLIEDHRGERWAVLQHNNMVLCLYEGHIDQNLMNFRGCDIEKVHREGLRRGLDFVKPAHCEEDGSWSAELRDPDGNCIYFNTTARERELYARTGRLIDYPPRHES